MSTPDVPLLSPSETAPRIEALDVLRGAAVLMMVLSGIQPFGPSTPLPGWMYHAQVPPPDHVFDPARPGITWVDLVFPWFLLALGAALPLAFAARRRRGATTPDLVRDVLVRGALLLAFAVVAQHVRPWVLGGSFDAPPWAWATAFAAWGLLWAAYVRLFPGTRPAVRWGVRALGVGGLVLLLALVRYPDGTGFRVGRYDIILVVLANMAVVGGLVVLATERRPALRYGVLALLTAAILAGREDGWVKPVMSATVAEGLFRPYYLKYLFLVLPGAFVGEAMLRGGADSVRRWQRASWPDAAVVAVAALVVTVVATAGLYLRVVPLTALTAGLVWATVWSVLRRRPTADDAPDLVAWLWGMGGAWLLLGFVAEPFEGGIRKDASTFSYYAVTGGLGHLVLAGLTVAAARFGIRLRLLAATGQNPMLAYMTLHNAVLPPLALAGLYGWMTRLTSTPWTGFGRALLLTLVTALVVAACTRRRWFWRS